MLAARYAAAVKSPAGLRNVNFSQGLFLPSPPPVTGVFLRRSRSSILHKVQSNTLQRRLQSTIASQEASKSIATITQVDCF